jgi:hypothetical protein
MAQIDPEEFPAPELSPLEQAQAKRAARKAAASADEDLARALDTEAIDSLEVQYGDSNVGVIQLPYTPGLPTCAAVRCPKPAEVKRFRDGVTPKHEKDRPDTAAAAELLAAISRVYPADKEVYAKLCAARPGLAVQLGAKAMSLAIGKDESEGKG